MTSEAREDIERLLKTTVDLTLFVKSSDIVVLCVAMVYAIHLPTCLCTSMIISRPAKINKPSSSVHHVICSLTIGTGMVGAAR